MGVRINIHSDRFVVKGDAKYLALALFRAATINKRLREAILLAAESLKSKNNGG